MDITPKPEGVLERIVREIKEHDKKYPDHGVGCACHDKHAREIRVLLLESGLGADGYSKSRANFKCVLNYIVRS